ncbi:hypothetical protein CgunFtcFv8_027504 [Champsocephalus gunnari]|uniref:Uncharacterized protein n=1 Tax=Champsocephalus gunnari TaxID=52237 RepID=A0AAN8E6V9_CHAGU|nr:hypothetical protein CgunFtcFv8_027504 [Champsocephalus gunnari]
MELIIKWPQDRISAECICTLNDPLLPQRHGATRGAEQTARRRLATGPLCRPASWTRGGCRTPRWTSDAVKLKRGDDLQLTSDLQPTSRSAGPQDPPLLRTLLSSGPSSPQDPVAGAGSTGDDAGSTGRTKGQRKKAD